MGLIDTCKKKDLRFFNYNYTPITYLFNYLDPQVGGEMSS